jgi:hypothetical protein
MLSRACRAPKSAVCYYYTYIRLYRIIQCYTDGAERTPKFVFGNIITTIMTMIIILPSSSSERSSENYVYRLARPSDRDCSLPAEVIVVRQSHICPHNILSYANIRTFRAATRFFSFLFSSFFLFIYFFFILYLCI